MSDTSMLINFSMQSNCIDQFSMFVSIQLYQKKIEFIFFVFIIIRSEVTFAASKLKQRNINFTFENHFAADRVIEYFYHTRFLIIQYDIDKSKKQRFVCANDASFADNSDWKNFQNFLIKLFENSVSWKISKQFTIIIFNIEIELLIFFSSFEKLCFWSNCFVLLSWIFENNWWFNAIIVKQFD